ncbi:MAG: ATP synthase subunit F [Ruminococcaceae bacterium]|nr:ATP synthase subunit F [Oscillospiraceae bacterium]
MKFYLISDNTDTLMGMRLAGIEGVLAHESEEVTEQLDKAMKDKDVAVILMTKKLIDLCRDKVYELKLNCPKPLIVEISDRHGGSNVTETIGKYINDAIGLKI